MSTLPSRRDIIRLIGASAAAAFAHSLGAPQYVHPTQPPVKGK
jgi:hypothetical protein